MAVVCSFLYAHKHLAPKKAFDQQTNYLKRIDIFNVRYTYEGSFQKNENETFYNNIICLLWL